MDKPDWNVIRPVGHVAMVAIDIVSFGHPSRTDSVQSHLRHSLYRIVSEAFDASGVPWSGCSRKDAGDGLFVIVPPETDAALLVDRMLLHLAAGVRRHNAISSKAARIQLRLSMHAGLVGQDGYGVTGTAVLSIFRLLDAPVFKQMLNDSGRDVGLLLSDYFYDSVVRHGLSMLDPDGFRPILVRVKETNIRGWLYIPGWAGEPPPANPERDEQEVGPHRWPWLPQ